MSAKSDRGGIEIAGADANRMLEVDDEDLAVADPAGSRHRVDGFDDRIDQAGIDRGLGLDLRQKAHGVFGAA